MRFCNKLAWLHCIILVTLPAALEAGEIYRSIDSQGRVTYSDQPSADARQLALTNQPSRHLYSVVRVYDGDTIILEDKKQIRLLGINTPEIQSRVRDKEPGGIEAKQWLQKQIQGKKVYLEFDQVRQDKYKRSLAHVFTPDGKHLNLMLLENGLAAVSIIPPNGRYAGKLIRAQEKAEKQKLGIWSMPEYQPRPIAQIAHHNKGWQRFTGIPVAIKKNRKYTRLIFDDKTDIRISNANLNLFPSLDTYVGKLLEIRGWVSRKKDNYTMLIQHPSALVPR
ncbi:thermonuclease family protein [Nitrosomonas sp.]|uniref:thermonuclease family protein n=1 Tax=Nitrosomonas sp. TaxID=42353 RepID=UPI001D7A6CB7|nr:thermonuclease family protein [Nitrosomonas sp.]MBX3617903.1 thermonuclease family protein [Nitrosomonas sp.]